jgi:hypothetical protein
MLRCRHRPYLSYNFAEVTSTAFLSMGVGNGDKWDSFEVLQDPVKLEVISVGPVLL